MKRLKVNEKTVHQIDLTRPIGKPTAIPTRDVEGDPKGRHSSDPPDDPDSIGMLMASLIERVTKIDHPYRCPQSGRWERAHLLTTVMNHLQSVTDRPIGDGVDDDESMLTWQPVFDPTANLRSVVPQDAIRDLDVPQVDLVVADLPLAASAG
ncbi:hypothetical protein [Limosilactobacillus fermentum]